MYTRALVALVALILVSAASSTFIQSSPQQQQQQQQQQQIVAGSTRAVFQAKPKHHQNDDDDDNHQSSPSSFESLQELDDARKRFEAILSDHHSLSSSSSSSFDETTAPLMTTLSRRRRMVEIELLLALKGDSDTYDNNNNNNNNNNDAAVVEELVTLWMTERGPRNAQILQSMQQVGSCSPGLVREEAVLREMCRDYPDWSEASFRLATLLYYQGQSQESSELCRQVLDRKPWHFEAAHLAVLHSFRELGNTTTTATTTTSSSSSSNNSFDNCLKWARMQLPPLNPSKHNARRNAWVQRAVQMARASLERAEVEQQQYFQMILDEDNRR